MTNTSKGALKGVQTKRSKYGKDYMSEIASKGGKASTSRPFKDSAQARRAVNIRWTKYRKEQLKKNA